MGDTVRCSPVSGWVQLSTRSPVSGKTTKNSPGSTPDSHTEWSLPSVQPRKMIRPAGVSLWAMAPVVGNVMPATLPATLRTPACQWSRQ